MFKRLRQFFSKSSTPVAGPAADAYTYTVLECPGCAADIPYDEAVDGLNWKKCPSCSRPSLIPRHLGPFMLYAIAGEGGMGRVYKASCDLYPDKIYAVKILPEEKRNDNESIEMLRHESGITALFNGHPNSVTAVEFDVQDGWAYLVTEYVEGETLETRIARQPEGLDEELVLKDMLDLTSLLESITSQGYLFRDLKPQNIIIRPDGRPVLLDYGIAMSAEEANSLIDLNYIDGSPHYVPPERLIGETEDARSEIYSLGMVMVHALTGRPYFQLSGKQAIAEAHVNGQRFSMTLIAPGITLELAEVLDRMICRRKEDRISSFTELRKALRQVATMTRRGPYFETTTQLIRLGDIAALRAGKSGKSQFQDKQREKTRKPGDQ